MEKQLNQNYNKASSLIFGTVALRLLNGLLNYLYSNHVFSIKQNVIMPIVGIIITVGLGLLLRKGINWVKYLLIIWAILGLIGTLFIIAILKTGDSLYEAILDTAQTIIVVWAVVLAIKIPKRQDPNSLAYD